MAIRLKDLQIAKLIRRQGCQAVIDKVEKNAYLGYACISKMYEYHQQVYSTTKDDVGPATLNSVTAAPDTSQSPGNDTMVTTPAAG